MDGRIGSCGRLPFWRLLSVSAIATLYPSLIDARLIARSCIVTHKALETWYQLPGDDASLVSRPKLIVDVITAHRNYNFSSMIALKFGRGAENTAPPVDYGESGPQGYLDGFAVGEQITCWQDPDIPEDIRLEGGAASDRQALSGFVGNHNLPILVLCVTVVAITACIFACVARYRKPGFDVTFPGMRRYCCSCCPWIFISCFIIAAALQQEVGGKALQHKFFQPMLIGIYITFVIVFSQVVASRRCQETVATNMTVLIGTPVYFTMFWIIAFVTLVPAFNWMHVWKASIVYMLLAYKMCGIVSAIAFNLGFVIFVCAYWGKITKALGIEGSINTGAFMDIIDPHGRKNSFIGVKVAVLDIVGKLPASSSHGANNLYVRVMSTGNEPVRTRTRNAQEGCVNGRGDSKVYALHEVLQFNIPMDYTSIDLVHFKVLDDSIVATNEVGRVAIRVCDIYRDFFDPAKSASKSGCGSCNTHKEVRLGNKITFMDGDQPCNMDSSSKAYELQFDEFPGPAYLWLGFLPGNEEAVRYLDSIYTAGGLGALFNCLRPDVGGVGSPDEYDLSEYTALGDTMESSSFTPLGSRQSQRGGVLDTWRKIPGGRGTTAPKPLLPITEQDVPAGPAQSGASAY